MCGIAGIVRWDGRPASTDEVAPMCDAIAHRGPDDQGLYGGEGVALGMRRLSIIDLATGHQPVRNEDGSLWVVFNGEIYNFKELRYDLERRGHSFYTTTDTETIVHLYEDYGPAAVEHLRGMFAFAIWDVRRRELFIARDRLGIKPLYYAPLQGGLAFASELKAILQVPEIERRLNWPALGHLFTFLSTPASHSILDGVHKLEPGHRALISSSGHIAIDRYWDICFAPDERSSEDELVERLRALIEESVALHLRSDVPLGVFLSGGIDSSAVLATATRLVGQVKTFSIGFTEEAYDEIPHARRVAKAFRSDHHELTLEPHSVDLLEDLTWYLDEPFGDSSAIPTYMVSKLAAGHVKVVLTGDGGDEIFAGYDKYVVEGRERSYDRVPAVVRRALGAVGDLMPEGATGRNFLRHLALEGAKRYLDASTLFRRKDWTSLFSPEVASHLTDDDPWQPALRCLESTGDEWLSALQYCDLRGYLPLDILTKVDRMTMAHSIEARPPLLDHLVVEFAATVPAHARLREGTTKYLFKRAMRGVLPDDIIDRPKKGFAVPLSRWFRSEWTTFVRDILLSDTCVRRGIFNRKYLEQLLRLHEGGRNLDLQLWTLVSFEQWCRRFLDRSPAPARELAPLVAVSA
jgi:asparagine synthase (glutamine-hydrolysing)